MVKSIAEALGNHQKECKSQGCLSDNSVNWLSCRSAGVVGEGTMAQTEHRFSLGYNRAVSSLVLHIIFQKYHRIVSSDNYCYLVLQYNTTPCPNSKCNYFLYSWFWLPKETALCFFWILCDVLYHAFCFWLGVGQGSCSLSLTHPLIVHGAVTQAINTKKGWALTQDRAQHVFDVTVLFHFCAAFYFVLKRLEDKISI